MKLCKHADYTLINWIKDPKWSTSEVLIDTKAINDAKPTIILGFTNKSAHNKYGWLVLDREECKKSKIQPNGRIKVYCVKLSKARRLERVTDCDCNKTKLL